MKKILLHLNSPALANNVILKPGDINNLNEPWIVLKNKLFELGFDLMTADNNSLDNCERILFIDSPFPAPKSIKSRIKEIARIFNNSKKPKSRNLHDECIKNGYQDKIVLFLWEGRSVKPDNYSPDVYDKFPLILTWDDALVDNNKFFKFYLPSPNRDPIEKPVPFREKKFIVNISANKNTSFPGESYSERRKAVKFFENKYPGLIDLFGPHWNKPIYTIQKYFPVLIEKFNSYQGIAWKKQETLSQYKFSLCYENLINEKGYITEKIFDCMAAGCVPIYWGADNVTEYIDKNAFIDRRIFKSDAEMADFLINMKEMEYNKYLEAIKNYLTSEKYKLFLPENFANNIIKTLKV